MYSKYRISDLPGKLRISLSANRCLCSLLFVPSGHPTSCFRIDSFYGWPNTNYQTRLCPLSCLAKSCSSFFCNNFTAATLKIVVIREIMLVLFSYSILAFNSTPSEYTKALGTHQNILLCMHYQSRDKLFFSPPYTKIRY